LTVLENAGIVRELPFQEQSLPVCQLGLRRMCQRSWRQSGPRHGLRPSEALGSLFRFPVQWTACRLLRL